MENEATDSSVPEGADLNTELLEPAELCSNDAGAQSGHFNIRTVIHNIPLTSSLSNFREDAKLFAQSLLESKFKVTDSTAFEGKWIPKTQSVEIVFYIEHGVTFDQARDALETEWLEIKNSPSIHNLWFEIDIGVPKEDSLESAKHRISLCQMSFGTFPSSEKFNSHWQSPSYSSDHYDSETEDLADYLASQHLHDAGIYADFEHDMKTLSLKYTNEYDERWKLEVSYNKLEKIILVNKEESENIQKLYFFTNTQSKVFRTVSRQNQYNDDIEDQEQRAVNFANCRKEVLGSSNVICLTVSHCEPGLKHIMSRLAKLGFSILLANPIVCAVDVNPYIAQWPSFKTFDASFSWFCLLSRGFPVTDQITDGFLSSLRKVEDDPNIEVILDSVINAFDRSFLCNLEETFADECEKAKQGKFAVDEDEELQMPHVVKVRRVLLTPTTVRGLGKEWTVENRVIREFGADRFIRVAIRDEDFQLLSPTVTLEGPVNSVIKFLTDGLTINERLYKFLGCSNSQLRQHGVWMYASNGEHTVNSIRKWMGDLSEERCVATYVARLGQCFSASKDSVEVNNVDRIDDVMLGNYCFTDGIGKISHSLGKMVSESLRMSCIPSAFQIRYGGSKGVVALAPDLEGEEKMQLRKSMVKFESKHNRLEVMQTTKPGRLYLNKQVVVLMSGLKVPDESFFSLQEDMLKKLADMLVNEEEAIKALSQANLGLQAEALTKSGIVVTMEPFLRSVLTSIYQKRFRDLLRRTRIEIPSDKGRIMMGTVDETGKLEYGQVFVQYSKEVNKQQVNKIVLTGQLVIAKNPCFHPGDLRKFEAIDIPELHHMVDCVVFPSKGPRPHPNEMSGSDLDGDMYFVCWLKSLIPPGENKNPMDFTAQSKAFLRHPVRESDMIQFIGNYISSDQVGVIANAHLVHADAKGIFADDCLKLAQLHSDAVDFPKTGQHLRIPSELRPGSYPHYMMKVDKPVYTSNHVIAKLFDHCQAIEQSSNPIIGLLPIKVDASLLIPGYEKYLESARMMRTFYERHIGELMQTYGIDSEAALLSVTMFKIHERRGYLKSDHIEIAELVRLRLQSVKKKLRKMFFEEFKPENLIKDDEGKETGMIENIEFSSIDSNHDEIVESSQRDELLRKASAIYYETYTTAVQESGNLRQNIGLPWMFGDLLIKVKMIKFKTEGAVANWQNFLHKISVDVIEAAQSIENERHEVREKRMQIFKQLLDKIVASDLVLFGSTVSSFDATVSSLDLYVNRSLSFQETVSQVKEATDGIVSKNFLENPSKKIATVTLKSDINCNIYLYSSKDCLERTAYIIAAAVMNKWLIPALKVALEWARKINLVVADAKEASLKGEEFILMFYYVVLVVYKNGSQVSEDVCKRSLGLLEQNHFLSCSIYDCTHLECQERTDVYATPDELASTDLNCEVLYRPDTIASELQVGPENVTENPARLGEILLQFFRYFGTVRGKLENCILDIPDLSSGQRNSKLIRKKPQQCQQIVKKMMQAHHSLANSTCINDFLTIGYSADGPFAVVLPVQFSSSIKYRKVHIANKIKAFSGADIVNIREKKFRGQLRTCMILEAYGSAPALLKVSEKVRDMVSVSSMFVSDLIPVSKPDILDAYQVCFEHCHNPDSRIILVPYYGPNQPGHDSLEKKTPKLFLAGEASDETHFVSLFNKQREFIVNSYDKNFNGELRAVISYGNYYICNCKERGMTVADFYDMISQKPEESYSAHVSPAQRYTRRRGRNQRRYISYNPRDRTKHVRSAFIPAESANIEALKKLLKTHNFVRKSRSIEYRPTIKMTQLGAGGSVDGVVVLSENFVFQRFILPDEKWFVVDTIRDKVGTNCHVKDMRFKIHSRQIYSDQELEKYPDLEMIVKNASRLLLRRSTEVYRVNDDFKDRIKFLRRKDVQAFEYSGKGTAENREFLHRITIRVNFGKEFSRPDPHGIFRNVSEFRTEVTVVPKLPDLQDAEESEQFVHQLWQFAMEFGELLQK